MAVKSSLLLQLHYTGVTFLLQYCYYAVVTQLVHCCHTVIDLLSRKSAERVFDETHTLTHTQNEIDLHGI
jgi:hypothetical protein